jgi:hypothetical protein
MTTQSAGTRSVGRCLAPCLVLCASNPYFSVQDNFTLPIRFRATVSTRVWKPWFMHVHGRSLHHGFSLVLHSHLPAMLVLATALGLGHLCHCNPTKGITIGPKRAEASSVLPPPVFCNHTPLVPRSRILTAAKRNSP